MTNQPKDIGPKQLAWLNRKIPAFKETRQKVADVVIRSRDAVEKAMGRRAA